MLAAFVAALSLPIATPSLAAEPTKVSIDASFTWTVRDLSTMAIADGREAYVSESFLVLTQKVSPKEPSVFPNLGGRCMSYGAGDPMTSAYQLSGWCELKDIDGNSLFEKFEESSAGNGAPGIGKGMITGGTGKFVGVTGQHDLEDHYYASPTDGVFQGIGSKKGVWQLPAP